MKIDVASLGTPADDEPPTSIDRLLDHLSELAGRGCALADFYQALARETSAALDAVVIVWRADAQPWEVLTSAGDVPWRRAGASAAAHADWLRGQCRDAGSAISAPGSDVLETDGWIFAARVSAAKSPAVIELIRSGAWSAEAREGCRRVLDLLADIADDAHADATPVGRVEPFALRVHATLDPLTVAYTLANDGAAIVGCDRLSVLARRGGGLQLLAVTGLDAIDPRATAARTAEQLAAAVLQTGEPLWRLSHAGDWPADDLTPQIEPLLAEHLDQSHAAALVVAPLSASPTGEHPEAFGALIAEWFAAAPAQAAARRQLELVAAHGAAALGHALEVEGIPGARLWRAACRTWTRAARRRARLAIILGAVALLIGALALLPAPLRVAATGRLEPFDRREAYAPQDAVVDEVLVQHGQRVERGQPLLKLRRPELDLEFTRVVGELQTARSRLDAIEAVRLAPAPTDGSDAASAQQLSAEREQLSLKRAALEKELALIRAQQDELTVRAPLDGSILTWDVAALLTARPVRRGQSLLTIARTDGPWVVELDIPAEQAGTVLSARDAQHEPLEATYVLATAPEVVHSARLTDIAPSIVADRRNEPRLAATLSLDDASTNTLTPELRQAGATVMARIDCGSRSLGYVLFHDLIRVVRSYLLF